MCNVPVDYLGFFNGKSPQSSWMYTACSKSAEVHQDLVLGSWLTDHGRIISLSRLYLPHWYAKDVLPHMRCRSQWRSHLTICWGLCRFSTFVCSVCMKTKKQEALLFRTRSFEHCFVVGCAVKVSDVFFSYRRCFMSVFGSSSQMNSERLFDSNKFNVRCSAPWERVTFVPSKRTRRVSHVSVRWHLRLVGAACH